MREVFRKIKAFYIQKKKLAVGVTVAILGVLTAVGVYAMIPEVKAAQGDTQSDPIVLTSGGKHSVEGGKWYKITGGFTDTYTLEYTGDGSASVNLILENINWTIGQDKPAIEFTGQSTQRDDVNQSSTTYTSSSSSRALFDVIISGENRIVSTCAAQTPLISAESIVYDVKTYGYQRNYGQNNELDARVVRDCKVQFKGNNSVNDVLILNTGAGSTGAAIGSADASKLDEKIVLDDNTLTEVGNTYVSLSGDYTDSEGVLYKNHQEVVSGNVKYGSGDINITHGANIIINGRGDGAGIGTGASSEQNITYKRNNYQNDKRGTISAKSVLDGDNVEINGGSVSVHMAENASGCCIGVGAIAGQSVKQGIVQIKSGNVDLVPSKTGYEFGEARNGNTPVYKFKLDLSQPPFTSSTTYQLEDMEGERFDVYADYSGQENADRTGNLHFTVSADVANSGMSGNKIGDYEFIGYAQAYFNERNSSDMYFYLPTKTLTPYKLEITSDSPEVGYAYTIGTGSEQIYNGPVNVKETKDVKIRLTNISKYCKSVTYTVSSKSGTSTQTVTVDASWDGTISFQMPSNDCTVRFEYEIPKYTINYDYGAGRQYASSIKNDNVRECSFGINYELQDISWENHIFMGWYLDADLNTPIEEIETPDESFIQSGYEVTVYAKWGCEVSFVDENGNLLENLKDHEGNAFTNPVILEMNPNAVLYPNDYPQDLEDTSLRAFDGWVIDGTLYEKPEENDEYPQKTINGNTVIQAQFHDIGYYVYIYTEYEEPNFGNIMNVEPSQVGNFATYYNYVSGEQNQPVEFEKYDNENGKYYRTKEFISGEDIGKCLVTCSIKAKKGYMIAESGIHAYNAKTGEEIELGKGEEDEQAYQFTMPDSDVYIKVKFEEGNYEVVYYDVNENDDVIPAVLDETYGTPVTEYNARSKEFKLVPAKQTDKYKKFVGWCKIGETEVIKDNLIVPQEHLENLYLYAKWEDVVTYPITVSEEAAKYITVYDTDRNMPVDKGIPGEKLKIVVTTPRGVSYNSMTWYYTDINHSDCVLTHTPAPDEKSPYEYDFIMPPASPVRIEGEFSLIEYHITYLNLNGAVNPNPVTYTVENKIELEALEKKGIDFKGWNIVLPDEDNYIDDEHFATKEEPIETIDGEKMSGNIILVAHWDPENDPGNTLYKILIDNGLMHGTMDSFATEAYGGQYVFFSAIPDRGYKLKNVSYSDTEPQVYSAAKALRTIEGILNNEFDIPLYEVAEGIYYFIMPDHDVNLIAEFEPIEYTITYIDGNAEDNPTIYTVEDEIWLTAPSKDGFEFLGWYDEADNEVSSIKDSTGNLVLTAKWRNLNPEPINPEPDTPGNPDTPDNPDDNQTPNNPPANQPSQGNTGNNSNSSIDKLLNWINNNSKVDSNEDKNVSNNKGNVNQQLSTGDTANIGHLALLCIMSLIIIIIACPKKREEKEAEESV
ncbi:MAG: InlB B-repeat-containing protein [Lachnospiraceae bacterium]|nr:InlB B-repeat-containing protein [Lachnospiraceae bacterium]